MTTITSPLSLPNEICALISTFLNEHDGTFFRQLAYPFILKEIKNGKTYGNGLIHSFNDMPAEVWYNKQYWYKNGQLHRDNDMPAVIDSNGREEWFKNGELHN
jgi:hypothetical protein